MPAPAVEKTVSAKFPTGTEVEWNLTVLMELSYMLEMTDKNMLTCLVLGSKWLNVCVGMYVWEWHVAGKQTGTPGADNQRTVIVPEASPTRSHSRCWRWQSGLGAQWQDFSARQDPAAAHCTRCRVCKLSCSAPQEHKSVLIAPAAVLREKLLYLKIPFRNVLRHENSLLWRIVCACLVFCNKFFKWHPLSLPYWQKIHNLSIYKYFLTSNI